MPALQLCGSPVPKPPDKILQLYPTDMGLYCKYFHSIHTVVHGRDMTITHVACVKPHGSRYWGQQRRLIHNEKLITPCKIVYAHTSLPTQNKQPQRAHFTSQILVHMRTSYPIGGPDKGAQHVDETVPRQIAGFN